MNNNRKCHFIFLWLMALFLPLQLYAQKGLNINSLFGGQFRKQRDASEVLMKGRQLQSYNLTLFRSLTLPVATANAARVEALVRADASTAIDKDAALRGKYLYYGFHRLRLFIWKDRLRSMNLDALLVNNDSVDLVRFSTSLFN